MFADLRRVAVVATLLVAGCGCPDEKLPELRAGSAKSEGLGTRSFDWHKSTTERRIEVDPTNNRLVLSYRRGNGQVVRETFKIGELTLR